MTAIKRACSCIRVLTMITCREERESERANRKKMVKYSSRAQVRGDDDEKVFSIDLFNLIDYH